MSLLSKNGLGSRRPTASAVALALIVQLCLVLQIFAVGQPAAADPVPPGPPTSVTLTADRTVISAGESAVLTATTDVDVALSGSSIKIIDQTANKQLKLCSTGSSCSVSTTFATGGPHVYVAQVNTLESGSVTVSRAPWTIALAADGGAQERVFPAGESVNLVATANQDVGLTGGALRIWIHDTTANQLIKTCDTGLTCAVSTRFYTGGPHQYSAVVASTTSSTTTVQTTSNVVTGTRLPWSVALTTNKVSFDAGDNVALTATANQDVGATNTKYAIRILDKTTNQQLALCTTGTTCAVTSRFYTGGPHTYYAVVSSNSGGASVDVQATSNEVTAARSTWTVVLTTDRPVFAAGEVSTLTATANQNLGGTGGQYSLRILDTTTNQVLTTCTTGTVCSIGTRFYTGGPHTYSAVVSSATGGSTVDVQATSNAVVLTRMPWTLALEADRTTFVAGDKVTLTATANQNVGSTNANYAIRILDKTTNQQLALCTTGTTCTVQARFYTGGAHTYYAVVSSNSGGASVDVQATSNEVAASRAPWTVRLDTSANTVAGGATVTLTATANQNVGLTGGFYRIQIFDYTAGTRLGVCETGTSCAVTTTAPTGVPHSYLAYVSQVGATLPPPDVQAISNGFSAPNAGGPTLAGETTGGSNPSENCSQRCHADPINSVTGEFFENTTDLAVPGVGPAPAFTRSYAATRAAVSGPLGFGWTHGYAMSLAIRPGDRGTTLATATQVDVRQENGALLTFTADGNGNYTAPTRVLAALVRHGDGTFTFTRQQRQLFTFDTAGKLVKLADRNANTLTLSYTGAQLTRVADEHNRYLDLTWAGGRITKVTDHTGREVSYRYSTGGDLLGVTDVRGNERTYTYTVTAAGGHLVASMTDVRGKTTINTYDANSRVLTQTDPLGRVTTFVYGSGQTTITDPAGSRRIERHSNGQVTSETVADGTPAEATTSYTYGPTNHVTATTDPLGKIGTAAYDAHGNQLSATDPLGRTTTFTYDAAGNLLTTTDPAGAVSAYTYDNRGNLLTATDPTGAETRYTVNADGTVATVVGPRGTAAGADPGEHTTRYGYNNAGARVSVTSPMGAKSTATVDSLGRTTASVDARGNAAGADPVDYTTTYTHDPAGNLLTSTDPTGATSTSTYDKAGHRTSSTDPIGRTTSYGYDDAGQLVTLTDPAGAVTTYTYDPAGRPRDVTDPLGHTTRTEYTAAGQPAKVTDALGHATTFVHDRNGRLTASTDADGATSATGYDDAGQVLTVTDPLGAITRYGYDQAGRRTTVTDADGRLTTTSYDPAGRQTGVTRNDGSTLAWAYNPAGNLTSYTDAAGRQTRYGYDADGRRTKTTDPLDRVTRYTYDPAGNLTATIAADGTADETVTTHAYNRAGLLKDIDYPAGTPDVAFGYDGAGRRTSMADGTGTSAYAYDPAGRLAAHTNGNGATVGYAYDTAGRLTAITYPGTPSRAVVRGYDNADRLTGVTDWNNQATTFAWTDGDQLDTITYPNGVVTDYTRDAAGQATGVRTATGTDVLAETATTYSPAGLIVSDTASGTNAGAGATSYDYDPLARINTVTTSSGASDFGFSPTHGLTTWADGITQTYDAADQLTTRTTPADPGAGTPAITTTYLHDARGNRTTATAHPSELTQTVTTYGYDAANRLTTATPATGPSSTYSYDGDGLRAGKTVGTGTQESFVWDITGELPMLLADATHDYLYGPAGHPYAQINKATAEVQYLHPDRLGSTRALTGATGARVAAYDYDPYGNPTTVSGPATTSFRYAGEYTDPETGLQYLRARYYDPTTAAFLTRDPIEDTTALPYSYTEGNPLLFTDPSGLYWGEDKVNAVAGKVNDGYNAVADSSALQHASDWSAGFGDAVTFGGTNQIRELVGANDAVNKCSTFYSWGGHGGQAASFVPIVGGARITAGAVVHGVDAARAANNGSRVFWSGGDVAKSAAADYAKANGANTLDMTLTGRVLQSLPQGVVPRKAWDLASARFARGATGDAHVFFGPGAPWPSSTFVRVEAPILEQRGNAIMQHFLGGP